MANSTTHIFRASLKAKLYREIEIESHTSLRGLAEYLERHPESLLKGKPEDPK